MRYLLTTIFAAVIGLLMVQPAQAVSPAGNSFYGSVAVGPIVFSNDVQLAGAGLEQKSELDVGYNVEGALGGWIGSVYRTELAGGWRQYGSDDGDFSGISLLWNSYFHILDGAHQPYFGFGTGFGWWSLEVDDNRYSDRINTLTYMAALMAGYDLYLSGLRDFGLDLGAGFLDDMVVGVQYRFSWSNPRFSGSGGTTFPGSNDDVPQINHTIMFSARYEF